MCPSRYPSVKTCSPITSGEDAPSPTLSVQVGFESIQREPFHPEASWTRPLRWTPRQCGQSAVEAVEADPKQIKTVIQIENDAASGLPRVGSPTVKFDGFGMIDLSILDATAGEFFTIGVDMHSTDPTWYDAHDVDVEGDVARRFQPANIVFEPCGRADAEVYQVSRLQRSKTRMRAGPSPVSK